MTANEAYVEHVRDTVGWTTFANTHTQISGREHKEAFMAGYYAGRKHGREKFLNLMRELDMT